MRKTRTTQVLAVATAAAVFAGLSLSSNASAVTTTKDTPASSATSDSRVGSIVKPTQAQAAAVAAIVKASPGTRATWDARFGTPRTLTPAIGKTLSGPQSGSAVSVAKSWLTAHKDMLGLTSADIAALQLRRDHVLPDTGTHVVQFIQTFDGLAAARGGSLGFAVTKDGSVLSYTGETIRDAGLAGSFKLSSASALEGVAGKAGRRLRGSPRRRPAPRPGTTCSPRARSPPRRTSRRSRSRPADGARAAYSVLFVEKLDEGYQVVVDAETGKQLYKSSLVQHDTGGTIYDNYPGAPAGGQPRHVSFDKNDASPNGYVDPTGVLGTGITTFGNNANAHANWSNYIAPVDQGPRPVSPTGQFDYRFADHWGTTKCDPTSYPQDQEPASTNLFYQHNRIHDEYYRLGFTESAGNFQVDNFGKDGNPGDAIQGLVQAGAVSGGNPTYTGRDNAYMLTLPDGIAPWSGMFLWEPIDDAFEGPCADGDFDAGVIQHEYSHGLSNRYVGTEDGSLGTHQSGSMGEGWGDWYALDYLHRNGYQKDSVARRFRHRQQDPRHPQLGLRPEPHHLR